MNAREQYIHDARICEEIDRMKEWDVDAVCDALNISTLELLTIDEFFQRAVEWVEENCE